jgi:RNA polymerase sigma factor (sigma-70 family)
MSHADGLVSDHPGAQSGAHNDASLIMRSIGSPDCFAELFDRHAGAIHRYIARRVGPDAADDLVAETFLAAFRRRDRYKAVHASALPWLYGIATNLVGRYHRDEVRLFRAISRAGPGQAASQCEDEEAVSRVAAQAIRRQLAGALAGLPAAQRDVLALVASGLNLEEAALALGVPVGTVSSRLARARKKLRRALGGTNPIETQG